MSVTEGPRPGDKVRVTVEGEYVGPRPAISGHAVNVGLPAWVELPFTATVEVLERADDPEIGLIRSVAPSADGTPKTAVKVGGRFSQFPDQRSVWVIVETGEVLADGDVSGIGPAVGAVPGTPAAEAEEANPRDVPGPRCNSIEGATGINCGLARLHGKDIEHEGWHEPVGERDSVGYRLFVRWPWNEWDRDAVAVGAVEEPLPDWERELLEKQPVVDQPPVHVDNEAIVEGRYGNAARTRDPRVFRSDGPEPPSEVAVVQQTSGPGFESAGPQFLVRYGNRWRWADSPDVDEQTHYVGGPWSGELNECERTFREVLS